LHASVTTPLQEIVVLLGQPVAGNPTQYMMEKCFAAAGLDWRYLTVEVGVDLFPDAMRGLRAMGFRGGNLTMPHKVAVLPLLDELSEAARLMGAVNCWKREGDKLIGENTDGKGFLERLREVIDPAGKKVVLLGAGGAARAIAVELGLAEIAHLTVVNRTAARGEALARLVSDEMKIPAEFALWEGDYRAPAGTAIVINGTSIGLHDASARVPLDLGTLEPGTIVADVVFNPPETRLLREARERGCKTIDGLGMLVNQAVIAFRIWTGISPDATIMRDALEEFLSV